MSLPDFKPWVASEYAAQESEDLHLREHTQSQTTLVQGGFLHAVHDVVQLPNGKQSNREYVIHPGAVMIIPVLDDGRLLVERQWRHPCNQVMLEFPAGKKDPAESGLACATRELEEETGWKAMRWACAGHMHPTIAYSTEVIEIWFAQGLVPGIRRLDEGEFLDVHVTTLQEMELGILNGLITDGKTMVGVWWAQRVLSGEVSLLWQDTSHESV
ncbi:MAG: hypothetical protein RLZZ397_1202 [Pseudomonadota bacterium]